MPDLTRAQKLLQLAEEPSSEKRRELLREITDIFLAAPENHSDVVREHFGHLLGDLSSKADVEARSELAGRVAKVDTAPESLVRQLARDEIGVASPVLEHSTVLDDDDLIEIVHSKGSEYQTSVARRSAVGEGVSSALVEVGHVDAVQALLQNAGARINRLAMEKAVDRSRQETKLQGPLVDRHDMPVDLLQDMFWFTSGDVRKKIVSISSTADPAAATGAGMSARKPAPPVKENEKVAHRRAATYIQNMKAAGLFGRPLLIDLFRRKAFLELIIGFAIFVNVSEATALQILSDENGESLVLACRASGFDIGSFMIFAALGTLKTNPRPAAVLAEMKTMFESITETVAKRVMRFWRIRESVSGNDATGE